MGVSKTPGGQADRQQADRHGGAGLLARLGIACLIGDHWPAAALVPRQDDRVTSHCADCGRPMRRDADGRWAAQPVSRPLASRARAAS